MVRLRKSQAINPSTKPGAIASHVAKDSDASGSENDNEIMARPKPKPEMRISSSSYKKSGHQKQDTALGSRTKGNGRIDKNRAEVNGERQVTFAPTGKRDKQQEKAEPPKKGRRDDGRRSASGNVFRKL